MKGAAKLPFARRARARLADADPTMPSRRPDPNAATTGPAHHSGHKGQADRLVRAGLRLQAQRTEQALLRAALGEAASLLAARRALLLLDGPAGPRISGCRLPDGEDPQMLLAAVTPWLTEARRSGAAQLHQGPEGAEIVDQRSCLVAPLQVGREVLGLDWQIRRPSALPRPALRCRWPNSGRASWR
jgi:hypothetical protein